MINTTAKESLFEVFNELDKYNYNQWVRLNKCTAYYQDITYNGVRIEVLRSYQTIVAFCIPDAGCVFVRDFYSNTTTQHVSKFANLMRTVYGKDIFKLRVDKMK